MLPASLIAAKRDRQELSDAEIANFIQGFATGSIPDYQMAAMAMAIESAVVACCQRWCS